MATGGKYTIRAASDNAADEPGYVALAWPRLANSATKAVESDLGWDLTPLPGVTPAVADLVHLAVGAYLADRRTRRGVRFSRSLSLRLAALDPDLWDSTTLEAAADLLAWLTGDEWELSVTPAAPVDLPGTFSVPTLEPVSLLSGGLDSFLGAITHLGAGARPMFLGHKDTSTAIRHAQGAVGTWLGQQYSPAPSYARFAISGTVRPEPTSRSRAFMFQSLGVAAAVSTTTNRLVVAENGYTSINLPLRANRGGALSTRSTHPVTFDRVQRLLGALGIDVTIENPFEWMTKGEAMTAVVAGDPPGGWDAMAALTVSCGKLGGNFFEGSPNINCGLCVPCLVRRGTFIASGVKDSTRYLVNEITGAPRGHLIEVRRGDIEAVRSAAAAGVDGNAIDAGTWPVGYDLDRAEDLVARGLRELGMVDLP
ncbi:hypothetical protein [Nocardioides taihuensis]|uniref:Queuosine biosynthesis protein queC n=1 Tax=Nocardioides taihuensis TaxID=1835606 RepID=A0ABW0BS66_9ACTN